MFRLLAVALASLLTVHSASAFDGVIDPESIALHERVRFTASPDEYHDEIARQFAVDGSGNYFTLWHVEKRYNPNVNVGPDRSVLRKFKADGSLAWSRARSVDVTYTDTVPIYTENWGGGDPGRTLEGEDATSSPVPGTIVATADGGVIGAFNLETLRGAPGNQYLDVLHQTLFVKFNANGDFAWRSITPQQVGPPAYVKDLLLGPDGNAVALCYTGAPYNPSPTTFGYNHQTLVRKVNGATGTVIFDGEYGGDNHAPVTSSESIAMAIDGQSRIYVLSAQSSSAYEQYDPNLSKYVVRRISPDGNSVERADLPIFGDTFTQNLGSLAVDADGNTYLAGSYLEASGTPDQVERAFLLKLNTTLSEQWRAMGPAPQRFFNDRPGAFVERVHLSSQGITTVGETRSSGVAASENKDMGETMRFDFDGNMIWHRYLEAQVTSTSTGSQFQFQDSRVDAEGNVYQLGDQTENVQTGSVAAFFSKYSNAGALQFVKFTTYTYSPRALMLGAGGLPTALATVSQVPNTAAIIDIDNPPVQPEPTFSVAITGITPGQNFPRTGVIDYGAVITPPSAPGLNITRVEYYLDGQFENAISSAPYNDELFTADLAVGMHTLFARALARGLTSVDSAPIQFTIGVAAGSVTNLTVNIVGPAGSGTVSAGFAGTTERYTGDNLTITALPKPGFIFTGWTGSVVSQSARLEFTVVSDMVLVANFAESPFTSTAGTYVALGESRADTGLGAALVAITVDAKGQITAKLRIGKLEIPFKSAFDADGSLQGSFTVKHKTVEASLQLAAADGGGTVTGTITFDGAIFDLSGKRTAFSKTNPAPQAGTYTFILPAPAAAGVPTGDSWFTARVKDNGGVSVIGALADATPVSYKGALGADGSLPLYASIAKGRGVFAGDLTFASPRVNDSAQSDVSGTIVWQRPATSSGAAFAARGNVVGSFFTPPDSTHTVFGGAPGNILLQFTSSPTLADISAALRPDGRATSTTTAGFKFRASNKAGVFAAKAPAQPKSAVFSGVVLQKQQVARGFVTGGATGKVVVTPQ